jgi:molecular chaperone DnaK
MSQTINFAIDLGTTNSLIAKYHAGKVEVFKNPSSLKETLPSVVAFRKERVIVGDKAREMVEKDPANVFSFFKRKMGTMESFFVKNLNAEKTPIQLSAMVLRELKNFVYSGETVESVVITIPASFDTIQSNATKKAGYEAGFAEVVLLQEPIAASLAFANKQENAEELNGQWLVYDLGGGTFDVALVRFDDGEMRVIDHEGDNFLGGLDFDNLIIERIVVPYLRSQADFGDLLAEMKNDGGRYNKLYYELRLKAEEVKIALSSRAETDIEFLIEDSDGVEHDVVLPIGRPLFESIVRERIGYTLDLIRSVLEKNSLQTTDIQQIIMIGGSTYIPLVKKKIAEELGIKVNQSVDPTNAVAIGAAFYAGNKTRKIENTSNLGQNTEGSSSAEKPTITLKTAYQKATQDRDEIFMADVSGAIEGMTYRLMRQDGGFDSGQKPLSPRISEVLPLVTNELNIFNFKVFDTYSNTVATNVSTVEIIHGKFSLYGQPLPNDICVEVDDFDNNTTKLEVIFEKNAILPLKKTLIRRVSKTINKGSDESLIINVLEGSRFATAAACLPLGVIEFKGQDLTMNLVKGSDVEIVIEVSESRDLKIQAVLLMTDQELSDIFSPSARVVNLQKLQIEVIELLRYARRELTGLEREEMYSEAAKVQKCIVELDTMTASLKSVSEKDVTDIRYQIEERKRKLAQILDEVLRGRHAEGIKSDYFDTKRFVEYTLENEGATDTHRERYDRLIQNERDFLAANNIALIQSKIDDLRRLAWQVNQNNPVYLSGLFHYFATLDDYTDRRKAQSYIELGEKALQRQNYQELKSVLYSLDALLPDEKRDEERMKGTGLG